MTTVEVFADISCPFTYVGLREVVRELDPSTEIIVRAWPLEWVNGGPLDAPGVLAKIDALRSQLGLNAFRGFSPKHWPGTTLPALNLVSSAYVEGSRARLELSLEIRDALFEEGRDIGDLSVLAELASEKGLPAPDDLPSQHVREDFAEGQRREVKGSPDFWLGGREFFCPSLELGHDAGGDLTARFDADALARFISRVRAAEGSQGDH